MGFVVLKRIKPTSEKLVAWEIVPPTGANPGRWCFHGAYESAQEAHAVAADLEHPTMVGSADELEAFLSNLEVRDGS